MEARDFAAWRSLYMERVPGGRQVTAGLGSFDELPILTGRVLLVRGRTVDGAVLLGDAAGAVHPHSGAGRQPGARGRRGPGTRSPPRTSAPRCRPAGSQVAPGQRAAPPWSSRSAIAAKTLDAPNAAWRLMRHGTFEAGRIGPVRRAMLAQQAGVGITG